MNIIEAIRSGRNFRRRNLGTWYAVSDTGRFVYLDKRGGEWALALEYAESILAEDWVVDELNNPATTSDIQYNAQRNKIEITTSNISTLQDFFSQFILKDK